MRHLIEEIIESLAPQLAAQGITWQLEIPHDATLLADQDQLRRAVLNLALNALDAMPDGGELVITSWMRHGEFELEVADSGDRHSHAAA